MTKEQEAAAVREVRGNLEKALHHLPEHQHHCVTPVVRPYAKDRIEEAINWTNEWLEYLEDDKHAD